MRKSVKIAMIAGAATATVFAVPFGLLSFWWWHKTAQIESFYREHRLLREMRAVQNHSTNDSGPAREALLQMLPLATDKEAAIAVLRKEGLGCQPVIDAWMRQRLSNSPDVSRTNKEWVDCQLETESVMGYVHWVVDLEFEAEHLSDARVTILYLSL